MLLALDFDGVVCDGLLEYFQTAWRAYCRIWQTTETTPPLGLAEQFYPLRPVIETGWEMPILVYALQKGIAPTSLMHNWSIIAKEILAQEGLTATYVAQCLDQVRDEWIAQDLTSWLQQHRFYPGVLDRLRHPTANLVIITTKEGRFVQQLLAQAGVTFPAGAIYGKETKIPKAKTLALLLNQGHSEIWFVEDRLQTLQAIQQKPELQNVRLFLADWGYNTAAERAQATGRISLLTLAQFAGAYQEW